MGLFTDIGNGIESALGGISDAVTKYQRNRRKMKELKYEAKLAELAIEQGARTYSGIVTGDSAYSSPANTLVGFGAAADPIADAVADSLGSYFGFQGVKAAANAASSAVQGVASAAGNAASSAVQGVASAAGNVAAAAGAPSNVLRTPIGDIDLTTAALVGTAAAVALIVTRER